jgi:Ca2+-binding EF-hand superfamily protein
VEEFAEGVHLLGMSVALEQAEAIFKQVDENGGGFLLFDEFCRFCLGLFDKNMARIQIETQHAEEAPPATEPSSVVPSTISRQELVEFLQHYNPAKVSNVDKILETFAGRNKVLLQMCKDKYGDTPPLQRAEQAEELVNAQGTGARKELRHSEHQAERQHARRKAAEAQAKKHAEELRERRGVQEDRRLKMEVAKEADEQTQKQAREQARKHAVNQAKRTAAKEHARIHAEKQAREENEQAMQKEGEQGSKAEDTEASVLDMSEEHDCIDELSTPPMSPSSSDTEDYLPQGNPETLTVATSTAVTAVVEEIDDRNEERHRRKEDALKRFSAAMLRNVHRMRSSDLFRGLDLDKSGSVSRKELQAGLTKIGLGTWADDEVHALLGAFDADGDGQISMLELKAGLQKYEEEQNEQKQKGKHRKEAHREQRRLVDTDHARTLADDDDAADFPVVVTDHEDLELWFKDMLRNTVRRKGVLRIGEILSFFREAMERLELDNASRLQLTKEKALALVREQAELFRREFAEREHHVVDMSSAGASILGMSASPSTAYASSPSCGAASPASPVKQKKFKTKAAQKKHYTKQLNSQEGAHKVALKEALRMQERKFAHVNKAIERQHADAIRAERNRSGKQLKEQELKFKAQLSERKRTADKVANKLEASKAETMMAMEVAKKHARNILEQEKQIKKLQRSRPTQTSEQMAQVIENQRAQIAELQMALLKAEMGSSKVGEAKLEEEASEHGSAIKQTLLEMEQALRTQQPGRSQPAIRAVSTPGRLQRRQQGASPLRAPHATNQVQLDTGEDEPKTAPPPETPLARRQIKNATETPMVLRQMASSSSPFDDDEEDDDADGDRAPASDAEQSNVGDYDGLELGPSALDQTSTNLGAPASASSVSTKAVPSARKKSSSTRSRLLLKGRDEAKGGKVIGALRDDEVKELQEAGLLSPEKAEEEQALAKIEAKFSRERIARKQHDRQETRLREKRRARGEIKPEWQGGSEESTAQVRTEHDEGRRKAVRKWAREEARIVEAKIGAHAELISSEQKPTHLAGTTSNRHDWSDRSKLNNCSGGAHSALKHETQSSPATSNLRKSLLLSDQIRKSGQGRGLDTPLSSPDLVASSFSNSASTAVHPFSLSSPPARTEGIAGSSSTPASGSLAEVTAAKRAGSAYSSNTPAPGSLAEVMAAKRAGSAYSSNTPAPGSLAEVMAAKRAGSAYSSSTPAPGSLAEVMAAKRKDSGGGAASGSLADILTAEHGSLENAIAAKQGSRVGQGSLAEVMAGQGGGSSGLVDDQDEESALSLWEQQVDQRSPF